MFDSDLCLDGQRVIWLACDSLNETRIALNTYVQVIKAQSTVVSFDWKQKD